MKRLERKIDEMKKTLRAKKRTTKVVRKIEDETHIIPWIVADTVIEEVAWYLGNRGLDSEAEKLYARREDTVEYLSNQADIIYKSNESWRKKIKASGNKGRDTLYAFMRHWLASVLRTTQPIAFHALPPTFSLGGELR